MQSEKFYKNLAKSISNKTTLGHTNALHAIAEASGFKNWQAMKSQLPQDTPVEVKNPEISLNQINKSPEIKPLHATLQLEMTHDDQIYPDGEPISIDVTAYILELTFKELKELDDSQLSSDSLVYDEVDKLDHNGPFDAQIMYNLERWLDEYGLPCPELITQEQWETHTQSCGVGKPKEYTFDWTKTYYASGTDTIVATSPKKAKELARDKIGDLEGSMQYNPDEDYVEVY